MGLEIHLFGEFELNLDGLSLPLKGAKPQALLAYLAAGIDRVHPRGRLTGLLWADHPEANARTNLRQALSAIRRVLPPAVLETEGDGLRLSSSSVWVDIVEFERLRRDADVARRLAAVALYDGDLLDGFRGKAAGFDDWLLLERESYRRQAHDLLNGLLEDPWLASHPEKAMDVCSRLIRIDPTSESTHRRLMRLYAGTGNSGLALRQFRVCEDVLQRELGVGPSFETVELVRHIKGGSSGAAAVSNSADSAEPSPGEPSAENRDQAADDRRPRLPSIVVLPFQSMSNDAEHGYLADGMTDELINMLANCVNWHVIARNTSFKFKDKRVDVRELGQDLGCLLYTSDAADE